MDAVHGRRPVLVVARDREWAALADAFAADGLRGWQARKATDFLHARFLLQHEACDVLLLDGASFLDEDGEVLVRLASRQGVPVVVLSGGEASGEGDDAAEDERQCLPRDLVRRRGRLLPAPPGAFEGDARGRAGLPAGGFRHRQLPDRRQCCRPAVPGRGAPGTGPGRAGRRI